LAQRRRARPRSRRPLACYRRSCVRRSTAWKARKVAGCVSGDRRLTAQGRAGQANIVQAADRVKDAFKG